MSFDFSIFDTVGAAEKGADLHLLHPVTLEPVFADGDKQKKPIIITLKGMESDDFARELQRRQRQNKGKKDLDLDETRRQAAETYAKLTLGWQNIEEDGKPLEFTKENAVKVFLKYRDIMRQVGDFIADKSNFIKS